MWKTFENSGKKAVFQQRNLCMNFGRSYAHFVDKMGCKFGQRNDFFYKKTLTQDVGWQK